MFKPKQLLISAQAPSNSSKGLCPQSCYVDQNVVRWEVVQDIPLGFGSKSKKSSDGHRKAHKQGNSGRIVGNHSKAIHCRLLERAVNKQAIVVCLESVLRNLFTRGSATYGRRTLYTDRSVKGSSRSKSSQV